MASITVVCGPMWSGKSEEIIAEANKYLIAGMKVLVVKPVVDKRSPGIIASRKWEDSGSVITKELAAHEIISEEQLRDLIRRYDPDIVIVDEGQFFPKWLYDVVIHTAKVLDIPVLVAGLDLDAWLRPFLIMPDLLALADRIIKKTAVCARCKRLDARFTQKLGGGKDQIEVGDKEIYEPRCEKCHILPIVP